MAEKGWLGADLIFDLDGDHLPGVSDNDFPAMIDVIQASLEAMERISGTGIRIQAKIRTIHIFRASRFSYPSEGSFVVALRLERTKGDSELH